MNKQNVTSVIGVALCILGFVFIMIFVAPTLIEHDIVNTARFEERAKQYFGTSNFTVESWDGYLVAKTPDGRQYPPQPEVDQYFNGKIENFLVVAGVAILVIIVIMVVYGYMAWKTPISPVTTEKVTKE